MIINKYFLLPLTVLALSLSATAVAKQPKDHGNKHYKDSGPEAHQYNSNKQSKNGDNVRGQDRADERHEINQSRDHDDYRDDRDRRDQDPRYNPYNQRNPVDTIIDRTMDNIDQKARELTGGQPRPRRY